MGLTQEWLNSDHFPRHVPFLPHQRFEMPRLTTLLSLVFLPLVLGTVTVVPNEKLDKVLMLEPVKLTTQIKIYPSKDVTVQQKPAGQKKDSAVELLVIEPRPEKPPPKKKVHPPKPAKESPPAKVKPEHPKKETKKPPLKKKDHPPKPAKQESPPKVKPSHPAKETKKPQPQAHATTPCPLKKAPVTTKPPPTKKPTSPPAPKATKPPKKPSPAPTPATTPCPPKIKATAEPSSVQKAKRTLRKRSIRPYLVCQSPRRLPCRSKSLPLHRLMALRRASCVPQAVRCIRSS